MLLRGCLRTEDSGSNVTRRKSAVPAYTRKKSGSEVGRAGTELRDVSQHVERAEMLGGKLEIKAHPGNGTIVKAAVPVNGNHKPRK